MENGIVWVYMFSDYHCEDVKTWHKALMDNGIVWVDMFSEYHCEDVKTWHKE
jgi:hypothetical protein